MEGMEQSFRTAAIGGFNRQDVLNYIEASAKSSAEKVESLKKEVEELRRTVEESATAAKEAEAKADALEKENRRLTAELGEESAALTSTSELLGREKAETEALSNELAALKPKVSRLESSAAAYAELKDRAGTIELEAHQRAMLIEHAAQENARKVRTEAEQLVYKMQAGYARLRTDVDATIAHASGELGRINRTLEGVKTEFAEHDAAFQKLLENCREQEGPKPLRPLPLSEEE
ncbi:MAG: hypothetical protein EOM52_05245 [Clostridia bacterium]|nr:hypothetical protein [Clostridia bacterium]